MVRSRNHSWRASLLPALALASAASAQGPVVVSRLRLDVGGGTAAVNETTVAVSEANPREIVAAWIDWRESTPEVETSRVGVGLSLDGGRTWRDFVLRPPEEFECTAQGDPMTAADPRTGTLWVGGITFFCGVFVARKDPGDADFQPAVMANTAARADKGWMAAGSRPGEADSTRLYIALNLGIIYSDDMGETWTDPGPLDPGLGHLPRVGPSGEVYVARWDLADCMLLGRSLDGARSFTTHTIARRRDPWPAETRDRFPGSFRVNPFVYLAVDPTDGTLYAVYADTTGVDGENSNVDLYFTRSGDRGSTWSAPAILNRDSEIPGDQFFPWIEVDRIGRIHAVFMDSRHTVQDDGDPNGMFDVYYAYSEDRGETWGEVRLTPESWSSADHGRRRQSSGAQFHGDYLGLAAARDMAYPVYFDTSSGDPDVYASLVKFPIPGPFVRGDCTSDGRVNISDAVFVLGFLFGGRGDAAPLGCEDACDADDSGGLDISDAVAILTSLFVAPGIPVPHPDCGEDPTEDAMGCALSSACR